jgi:D-amino-acid dehydrogenase
MKVLVLGAGVIGVTCAYYLNRAGHEVVVVDRQSGPAMETSFANAGGVCPGFAGPWAAPGMPWKLARWLLERHAPLSFRLRPDSRQWRWLAAFLRNCSPERFAHNKARMQRIAHYSKACLASLREETGIAYDQQSAGVLQIFRTDLECALALHSSNVLESYGIRHAIVTAEIATTIEPALKRSDVSIAGGLHLPDDETGDCHLFTARLADLLRDRGVTFQFGTTIRGLVAEGGRITGIVTNQDILTADRYVVALGSEAPLLLHPLGIDIPIYPVKGYSITIPIGDDDCAPRSSVMDEHTKVMITRLGARLRAAGVAEIGGYDRDTDPRRASGVRAAAAALFPDAGDYDRVTYWSGLRPMTPDGPPYLGATNLPNLFLNLGQGSNGWTQACGCGRIVANLVDGAAPEISLEGLTLMDREI